MHNEVLKYRNFFIFILLFIFLSNTYSQGLKFRGNEVSIDKRTSFSVFKDKEVKFSKYIDIRFDLSLLEPSRMGYIMRMKNVTNNTTYNILLERDDKYATFKFNEEGNCNLMTVKLSADEFMNVRWVEMHILFDLKNNALRFEINSKAFILHNLNFPDKSKIMLTFGKSDYIIDVPSFAIKNLKVKGRGMEYDFPLDENNGNIVHLAGSKKGIGQVTNPAWIINDAYYWKYRSGYNFGSVAGYNYNPEREEIYYFNRSSMWIYNVRSGISKFVRFANGCPVNLFMGNNFIDYIHNNLYVYEVYGCKGGPSVARLDLNTYRWWVVSRDSLPIQMHHHDIYYDIFKQKVILFGGFGNMRYNGNFYELDVKSGKWNKILFKGERIDPRYFSSMGYDGRLNTLYLFGGMGNVSGDQTIGRKYFYDFSKIDLSTGHITKLWKIDWMKEDVVPVERMIIMNKFFYTLLYPEHFTNSFLKLYRFSIADGSFTPLADSIHIVSDKIKTNANLFFNPRLNEIYAVIQEFDSRDTGSKLRIYSLLYPPVDKKALSLYRENKYYPFLLFLLLFFIVAGGVSAARVYFYKKKQKLIRENKNPEDPVLKTEFAGTYPVAQPNSILLFGDFMVRNRSNRDISYLFSSKLKQAFVVLLYYSKEGGIQSSELSELLWPEKEKAKVKNSRGVTINHLRKILRDIEGADLVYKNGLFSLILEEPPIYCDYSRCLNLLDAPQGEESIRELMEILKRGKFLKLENNSVFDRVKDHLEQKIIPFLLVQMKHTYNEKSYYFTISLAESMFDIDPINESAAYYMINSLFKLKKDIDAKNKWLLFISEYEKIMGEKYPKSLSSFLTDKNLNMLN